MISSDKHEFCCDTCFQAGICFLNNWPLDNWLRLNIIFPKQCCQRYACFLIYVSETVSVSVVSAFKLSLGAAYVIVFFVCNIDCCFVDYCLSAAFTVEWTFFFFPAFSFLFFFVFALYQSPQITDIMLLRKFSRMWLSIYVFQL